MTHLRFDQTIQWWSTPEEVGPWLEYLDKLEKHYAGDATALTSIRIERQRVQREQTFAERVEEDQTGRLHLTPLTDETP